MFLGSEDQEFRQDKVGSLSLLGLRWEDSGWEDSAVAGRTARTRRPTCVKASSAASLAAGSIPPWGW